MAIVQILLDKKLLHATDQAAKGTRRNRSALVREPLRAAQVLHEQPGNRLPHASWGSKRGHHNWRDQEIFLTRISAFRGSFTSTGPVSP